MPDGSNFSAFHAMDRRLVQWGLIQIRGLFYRQIPWDSDAEHEKREWSGDERAAAFALHGRVIRLPEVRQRLVLQVFYRESCAAWWDELEPRQKRIWEAKLTHFVDLSGALDPLHGVNKRLAMYEQSTGTKVARIREWEFTPIRERAIRQLVANERIVP